MTGSHRRSCGGSFKRACLSALALGGMLLVCLPATAQDDFDHFSTGFLLDGAHVNVTCDRCHVGGTFSATQPICFTCHSQGGLVRSSAKPLTHPSTLDTCEDCHITASWSAVPFLDHTAVIGNCIDCHNGVTATGKHPGHIASSDNCDDCHTTIAWRPANFDHANVVGNCFGCHNGVIATGKNAQHILTTNVCEDCHSTVTWSPELTVDHDQVLGSCSSCHDGTAAAGKDGDHFVTAQECDTCHFTFAWTPADYRHLALAFEPQDHNAKLDCAECHEANSEIVAWPSPAYQPDCAGCHAGDFKQGPHKKHENPDVKYTVSELRDCTGACHVYTDATLTTILKNRPGPKHKVSDGDF